MTYETKTWVDRSTQYPTRRILTDTTTQDTQTVTVERDEGDIYAAGDALNATNLNDLESRINTAFESAADWIVDIGTDGVWTYEKWNSGKAVCYGRYSSTITVNPGSNTQYAVALPAGLFVGVTYANVVPRGTHAEALNAIIGQTDSSNFVFYIGSLSSSGTYTTQPYMEAKGTWK